MPQKEFSKSMKAKMYDFTYTPFMSSMVIAWIILNHKYILIYMASIEDFDMKLKLLKNYDFSLWGVPYMYNIIMPISFGLFYTFIYPFISKYFYKFTLNSNKKLKTIKKDIEDNTPITVEEAKALKKENYDKTEKILELEDKITAIRSDYDMKLTTIEDDIKHKTTEELNRKHALEIKDIKKGLEKEYKKQYTALEKDCTDTYQSLSKEKNILDTQIKELWIKYKELDKKSQSLLKQIPKKSPNKETDKDTILRFFYESNYKTSLQSNVLDAIVERTKLPRPIVQKTIDSLIAEQILSRSSDSYKFIDITTRGNEFLIQKFYNKETK